MPIQTWSIDEVQDWFQSMGLHEAARQAHALHIRGRVLIELIESKTELRTALHLSHWEASVVCKKVRLAVEKGITANETHKKQQRRSKSRRSMARKPSFLTRAIVKSNRRAKRLESQDHSEVRAWLADIHLDSYVDEFAQRGVGSIGDLEKILLADLVAMGLSVSQQRRFRDKLEASNDNQNNQDRPQQKQQQPHRSNPMHSEQHSQSLHQHTRTESPAPRPSIADSASFQSRFLQAASNLVGQALGPDDANFRAPASVHESNSVDRPSRHRRVKSDVPCSLARRAQDDGQAHGIHKTGSSSWRRNSSSQSTTSDSGSRPSSGHHAVTIIDGTEADVLGLGVACLEHMENLTMHDSLLEHTAALMDSFALLELDLSGSRRLHDISGLQNCFSLRALNLSRCIEIPPHQFRNLEVSTLQVLNLAGCKQLTDEALTAIIRTNTGLRDVDVALCVNLSHDALAVRCGRLAHVDQALVAFAWLVLCFDSLQLLQAMAEELPGLHRLNVSECRLLEDRSFQALGESCSRLLGLIARGVSQLTVSGLLSIATGCPALRMLDISRCARVTNDGVRVIAEHCGSLREVQLERCSKLSDAALEAIGTYSAKLERVGLSQCINVSDKGLTRLARGCRRLRSIDLSGCWQLSDAAIAELTALKHLRELDISDCQGIAWACASVQGCIQNGVDVVHMSNSLFEAFAGGQVHACRNGNTLFHSQTPH